MKPNEAVFSSNTESTATRIETSRLKFVPLQRIASNTESTATRIETGATRNFVEGANFPRIPNPQQLGLKRISSTEQTFVS